MFFDKLISGKRTEVAKRFNLKTDAEIDAFFLGMEEATKEALDKRDTMLMDTITELCEAKQLLRTVVDDFKWLEQHTENDDGGCVINSCANCPFNIEGTDCKWKHEAEALKLIGG